MRKFLNTAFLLVLAASGLLGWALLLPVTPPETRYLLLRPGWTTRRIARELYGAGVIRSEKAFILLHLVRRAQTLKAGEYKFEGAQSALLVHDRLARGDVHARYVTVPEGYNMFDVARAVESAGLGPAPEFLKIVRSEVNLIRDLDPEAQSLEGYLFPDTYQFTRTMSMRDIVGAMVRRFRQEARGLNLTQDVHRIVTMASIIEKETSVPDERPEVASVYYNRLKLNMALAADPSVIYAALLAGRYRGSIYQSDLQYDSAYNTYRFPGLPPGPIASPGRASIEAAMRPATTDYLYFVADGQGGRHRFARSLDEHNRNVAAYRRALSLR